MDKKKNKDICISLLNEILRGKIHREIKEVKFLNNDQPPEIYGSKASAVDVLCKDQDGCQYIIEMQVVKPDGFKERAQYYAARAFGSKMIKGGKYEDLKKVIFLAFTNYLVFPEEEEYKSDHENIHKKSLRNYLDKMTFTFIELSEFLKEKGSNIDNMNLEERFYYFLAKGGNISPDECEKLQKEHPIIKKAYHEIDRYYWTPEEKRKYDSEQKRATDYISCLVQAKEEGLKKGEEKGLRKGKEEIAKQMLRKGMDIKLIQEITGLPPQLLEQMRNHIKPA